MVVDRLLEGSASRIAYGMDSFAYAIATGNMANSVLRLGATLLFLDKNSRIVTETEILRLAYLIARAIAYSSIGHDSDAEAPIRYERTNVLAAALSILLRDMARDEHDLLFQYQNDFVLAGKVLSKLASLEVLASTTGSNRPVILLARESLATMVEVCSWDGSSFVLELLSMPVARSFTDLVAHMDISICSLLEVVAQKPHGSEILVNAGVLDAMDSAGSSYAIQEAAVLAKIQQTNEYRQTKIMTPDFLLSHLKLLTELLATSVPAPSSHLLTKTKDGLSLPEHAFQILGHYKNTFHRLCSNFPVDADVLRAFLRCVVSATTMAMSVVPSFSHLFSRLGFFEGGFWGLCRQLVEHPLPVPLLSQVPASLKSPPSPDKNGDWHGIVKVELPVHDYNESDHKRQQQTWWEVLKAHMKTRKVAADYAFSPPIGSNVWLPVLSDDDRWSETTYEYAIVAADILGLSLTLIVKLHCWDEEKLDFLSLCRGLRQHVLAAKVRFPVAL